MILKNKNKIKVDFPAIDIFNITDHEQHFKNFIAPRIYRLSKGIKYNELNYSIWDVRIEGSIYVI